MAQSSSISLTNIQSEVRNHFLNEVLIYKYKCGVRGMFKDVVVLDFSRLLPGPYASMLLADMGAQVIKVEEPKKGDYMRDFPPSVGEEGAFYLAVNRGKKSIAIDYRTEEGRNQIYELVKKSDVVLESFRPGAMKAFKLDYETLKEINPKLIYCSLTGYGQKAQVKDKAGHDVNYLSLGGALNLIAHAGERPVIPGIQIADLSGGTFAALAISTALYNRNFTGEGKYLDIAMLDGILSWYSIIGSQNYLANKEIQPGKLIFAEGVVCYNVYETKDKRYMALGALEQKFWQDFCTKIGRDDLIERQFEKAVPENETYQELINIFAAKELSAWVELFADEDVCLTPVLNPQEVISSDYVKENEMLFELEHPRLGSLKQIHSPISKNFSQDDFSHPPKLGENTDEILTKFKLK